MIESRMSIDKIKFGKFIASRRRELSTPLTQKLLAGILSVGTSAIGKIEAGETLPSFDLFIDLADALMMSPGELMMVMAERADESSNYGEMNDWLYQRVNKLLWEYQTLTDPSPGPKPGSAGPKYTPEQARIREETILRDLASSRLIAAATPDVSGIRPEDESELDGDKERAESDIAQDSLL